MESHCHTQCTNTAVRNEKDALGAECREVYRALSAECPKVLKKFCALSAECLSDIVF